MVQTSVIHHSSPGNGKMDRVRKITNELAIAGQPTWSELQQISEQGYRSVVNLRSVNEVGFLRGEQQRVEDLGLHYVNISIQLKNLNFDNVLPVVQQLAELPKPTLVHCDNGIRSSIIVLINIAMKQGMSAEDAFQKITSLG